jgi:hypothetical protein
MKHYVHSLPKLVALSIIVLLIAVDAGAQNEPSELLRWFPRAEYQGFLHYDAMAFVNQELDFLHALMTREVLKDFDLNNIPTLRNTYDSATLGLAGRIFLDRGTGAVKTLDDSERFLFIFNVMGVYRYSNLDEKIAHILKRNDISETRIKLFERPVYLYQSKEDNGIFLYATPTGELLVSTNKRVIVAMVRTGMGRALGILDEQYLTDLPYLIPDMPMWAVLTHAHEKQLEIDKLRNKGADVTLLDDEEEELERSEQYSVITIEYDKEIIYSETVIFNDSSAARKAFQAENYEQIGTPFPEDSVKSFKRMLEGDRIIETTRHDVKVIRKQISPLDSDR